VENKKMILYILAHIIFSTSALSSEVIAHRGASGYAPENTISAIKKAIELESTFIEIDIHMTSDGHVVVFHDDRLKRTTNGEGFLKEKSLKELKELDAGSWFDAKYLGEKIPTLAEVLKLDFKKSKLIIEVKNVENIYAGIEKKTTEIVNLSSFPNTVIYKSFSSEVLERFNKLDPFRETLYVTIGPLLKWFVIDDWFRFGSIFDYKFVDYIQVHRYLIDKNLVQKSHALGKKIIVWDVHTLEDIHKMQELGVDIIETDYPDRVLPPKIRN